MRAFILVLLVLFASFSHAVVTNLTANNIQNLIAAHNNARAGVVPAALTAIPNVVYDNTVALSAQANVQRCNFSHQSGGYGENLAGGSAGNFPEPGWESTVVSSWVSENVSYNVYTNGCTDTQSDCLHYTQVVWANTLRIGCARADNCSGGVSTIISCQYDPPGNFIGQTPYVAVSQSIAPASSQVASAAAPSSQVAQVSQSGAAASSQVAQVSQSGAAASSQVAQVSQSGAAASSQVAQVSQSGAGSSKAGQSQSGAAPSSQVAQVSQSGAAPSSQAGQISQSGAAASSQVAQQSKSATGSQSTTPSVTHTEAAQSSGAQSSGARVSPSPSGANVTPTRSRKAASNTRPTKPQRIACKQNCHQAFLSCKRSSNVRVCKRTKKTCVAACIAPQ